MFFARWKGTAMVLALAFVLAASCGRERSVHATATALDDFGDTIVVSAPATRIVSLNPVTTEMLFAMGEGRRVIGRTHFDLYPESARTVPDLGDGIQPNVEAVLGARPDLVILYASNANRGAAARLRRAGITTLAIHTDQVADVRRAARLLSIAVGDTAAGTRLADSVERSLRVVSARPRPEKPPTVFWLIWETPIYTIGGGSYLSELVEAAGARNVFGDLSAPGPQVTMEEVVRRNPDYILAGPVGAAHIRAANAWRAVPAAHAGRILVVDTTLVGRPGVRIGEAARYLRALILHDTVP
ncbi:MAG: ABC transporter substrate-binding protein [Gemmatimonadales bacterium]